MSPTTILILLLTLTPASDEPAKSCCAVQDAQTREAPFDPLVRLDEAGLFVETELIICEMNPAHFGFDGVRVVRVRAGTAAAKAGLKPGDKIRTVNGHHLGDFEPPAEYSFGERHLGWLLRRRGRSVLGVFRPKVGEIRVSIILP